MIDDFSGEYAFLSNFAQIPAAFAGIVYPTAEHAFQAAKSTLPQYREKVLRAPTPGKAKLAGRSVQLRENWDEIRFSVMAQVVADKFTRDAVVENLLLSTGHQVIVEGNRHHDNVWGDCKCGRPECRKTGLNYLGVTLMSVRETLKRARG